MAHERTKTELEKLAERANLKISYFTMPGDRGGYQLYYLRDYKKNLLLDGQSLTKVEATRYLQKLTNITDI